MLLFELIVGLLLCLHDDGTVEQEIVLARVETARAARRSLDGDPPNPPHQDLLRREYEARLRAAASAEAR